MAFNDLHFRTALRLSAASLAGTLLLPAIAHAQAAAAPAATTVAAPAATTVAAPAATTVAAADAPADVGDIVVTGTRVQREGFTAPTPVTIVGEALIQAQAAVRVTDVLNNLPSLRATPSPAGVSQQQGGNFLALRGLGPVRTLILVNNRRFVATTVNNLVDANVIPTALIERIEVVTGGASAAWGSDAVAGVTNFILKKDLKGITGNAQYGQSTHGDAKEYAFALAGGTEFGGGRGHVSIAGEYSKSYDPVTQDSRDWSSQQWAFVGGPSGLDRIVASGVTSPLLAPGGVIIASPAGGLPAANSPLRGIQFGANGAVMPFTYGTNGVGGPLAGNASQQVGGSGVFPSAKSPLTNPLERYNAFAQADFQVTDTIKWWAEGSYARSKAVTPFLDVLTPNAGVGIQILRGNPFIPAAINTILAANPGIASFGVGRVNYELGRTTATGDNKVWRIASGLDGEFGDSWKWEVHGGYGQSKNHSTLYNHLITANLRAAADVVTGPGGTPICRINSTAPGDLAIVNAVNAAGERVYGGFGSTPGCVPLNPFGTNSISPAAAAYVTGVQTFDFQLGQTFAGGSVTGEPFSTWAGPVSLVVGADYRRESLNGNSDAISQLSTAASRAGGFQYGNPKPIDGSYTAKEVFGEVVVPLIHSDTIKALDLNGAVRYTDYSTSGGVTTWKLGATFEPTDGILFRATRSRDIRAPNLNELFLSTQVFVQSIIDFGRPGNPSSNGLRLVQGNPALEPEKADTTSIGMTVRPEILPGFRASIDWYRIDVKGAIGTLGGQDVINFCYGQGGLTQDTSYCAFINRNPDGSFASVVTTNFNLQSLKTEGVDLELAYNHNLGSGNLGLRFLGNYLHSFVINSGTTAVDRAGEAGQSGFAGLPQGSPKWRSTFTANYTNGPLSLLGQWRFVGKGIYDKLAQTITPGLSTYVSNNSVPAVSYFDLALSYKVIDTDSQMVEVYLRGDNIFDKDPPIIIQPGSLNPLANPGVFYDYVGAKITGGVRFKF